MAALMTHSETQDTLFEQIEIIEDVSENSTSFTFSPAFEVSEIDLLNASAQAGTFDFLKESSEDIY